MMNVFLAILAVLVVAALVGVAGAIAYGNGLLALLAAFAFILFMWLGFFIKAKQQASRTPKK
ncbi:MULTISPECIES: hypothetical protein [unclassified Sporolactobacillus]|uniref:hypothetical protein n=1 Tax=unclassified Sporolactobacillus TaxID=2628533 RepID=UPI0023687E58|nr:hypothetical protein [Sporolactobacillus sp. CQH2019]MDD9147190.1 hypothetical protein [Sporolactobacillus sp. CQH2019]